MKRKKFDFFGLVAVTVCVLGSALLLRVLLSGALDAYSNKVQVSVQGERIRTPLQESEESGDSSVVSMDVEGEMRASPEPARPDTGEPETRDAESGTNDASGLPGSPMEDEAYLAGYKFTQQAENLVMEACYSRYGEAPLVILKTYMESSHSNMGYAWLGVAEMPEGFPVIFHYNGVDEVWTQRSSADIIDLYLQEQSDHAKQELRSFITVHIEDSLVNGVSDWDNEESDTGNGEET